MSRALKAKSRHFAGKALERFLADRDVRDDPELTELTGLQWHSHEDGRAVALIPGGPEGRIYESRAAALEYFLALSRVAPKHVLHGRRCSQTDFVERLREYARELIDAGIPQATLDGSLDSLRAVDTCLGTGYRSKLSPHLFDALVAYVALVVVKCSNGTASMEATPDPSTWELVVRNADWICQPAMLVLDVAEDRAEGLHGVVRRELLPLAHMA